MQHAAVKLCSCNYHKITTGHPMLPDVMCTCLTYAYITAVCRPRAYLSELKLTSLPHVITLKITTLSWSLPSIWKQVAALQNLPASRNADHSSAGGSSSIPHQAAGANSSAHSNSIRGGGGGYALRSLTIEHVPNTPVSKLALVGGPPKLPPLQLTHLTTPLPGQFDSAGAVVCALNAAHANYLFELAAGLPELVQLQVLGQYEGHEGVFERFDKLQELRCELGQAFRCAGLTPLNVKAWFIAQ